MILHCIPLCVLGLMAAPSTRDTEPAPAVVSRMPDAARMRAVHELLASEPHVAGTPGDARTIERLAQLFREMGQGTDGQPLAGFEVEVQEFFPLLARPVSATVAIKSASGAFPTADLSVTEPWLERDPDTVHPDLDIAWNAWSGSGRVEAGVVYVNYGRREDFARLAELGVDPRGKIALARYGRNYRGYKAKFAEEAGCVGLVIFTDPADSGPVHGKTWPDGGWAHPLSVQRGSILTLGYSGDPLTPGREATKDAVRLDPEALALPRIPVHPIGWDHATRIITRMKGRASPTDWRGGIDAPYALDDADLRILLEVRQTRAVARTANVVARLRGRSRPDEEVVLGSHHDAWCAGAADPLAGTMCTLEAARIFTGLARQGVRADRTLVFCMWGAEEYGIFGSTEFVERGADDVARRTVAYLNLDMSAMGLRPGANVSPTLRASVARAIGAAAGPRGEGTALDAWAKKDGRPSFGDLGGGSDHVAFWCHAGVPSMALSAGGSEGVSYHSNYDTLAWYRANVGDDYASGVLVAGIAAAVAAELADSDRSHVSASDLVADSLRQARELGALAKARGLSPAMLTALDGLARRFEGLADAASRVDGAGVEARELLSAWMHAPGLDGRPWFRNLYAATDRYSGYGTSGWPLLREAIEDATAGNPDAERRVLETLARYSRVAEELDAALARATSRAPEASR
jgi:N-acetylated-alpha-linked acidic dipeptidase